MSNAAVDEAAAAVAEAFSAYRSLFAGITSRAAGRFARGDWAGAQVDARERLLLYKRRVDATVSTVSSLLDEALREHHAWAAMRDAFTARVMGRDDGELAETFFNSVTRKIFATVGVDAAIEFLAPAAPAREPGPPPYRTLAVNGDVGRALMGALESLPLAAPFADLAGDVELVARAIVERDSPAGGGLAEALDYVPALFYRNKGAYVVGRLRRGAHSTPLVLPLLRDAAGVRIDAALLTSDEASVVFGFSWTYFHVDAPRPRALVAFLAELMPLKRTDELYTAIGFNKHGKTELYRSLAAQLERADSQFEVAEGEEGMVMSVFTLPSFNVVFKIIKDRFGAPKRTTRRAVMDKYHFVFVRDRAGRLADAQEFEFLEFRRSAFRVPLLRDLLGKCGASVRVEGDRVVVRHLYTERRTTPLNLYLAAADRSSAEEAVLDYGNAIKDLAGSNVFTGDMLPKNFGVSRHGRVICYDYDELCLLTECRFRRLPRAQSVEEETAAEPWFHVGDNDVFPEEFRSFLVPPGRLRTVFLDAHADLLNVDWWCRVRAEVASGEIRDVFPYPQHRRLRPAHPMTRP